MHVAAQRRHRRPSPRETLHDRVYAELRRSLIHGVFDAGQMLRIQDLAEKLQTSTMPVREALARLVSEQALEALPNRSVRVPRHHARTARRPRPRPRADRGRGDAAAPCRIWTRPTSRGCAR